MRLIDADMLPNYWIMGALRCGKMEKNPAEMRIVFWDDIKSMPTIDPESLVRHGRWIWKTNTLYPKPVCSRCGEEPWRRSNHQSDLPNYCPKCGAKMDLEDKQ